MPLANSTIKIYTSSYKRLLKNNYDVNMDFTEIMEILDKFNIKDKTKMTYLKAIIWQNKHHKFLDTQTFNKIQEFMKSTNNEAFNKSKRGLLTDQQNKNYLKWDDIKYIYENAEKTDIVNNYVLLALYILHPPRRVIDYSNMWFLSKELKNLPTDKNYFINVKDPYFLFNNYKTSNTYGTQKIYLSPEMNEVIQKYIKQSEVKHGTLLFGMTESNFKQKLRRLFYKYSDRYISVNILRHSFISYLQNNNKLKTIDDRENYAKLMSHGVMMQLAYYKTN